MPADATSLALLVPDWPAPARVHAVCTTRAGGVSAAPYDTLNLGDHVGDDPLAVSENRKRYTRSLDARPVFMQQVHGTRVAQLTSKSPDGIEADACWTTEAGLACTIMVADCLPVLLADVAGRVAGAAHCGWRGLAGVDGVGALESLWRQFQPEVASDPSVAAAQTLVWLGPCIGPDAFEVGPEVKAAFEARDRTARAFFKPHAPGKWMADLQGLARLQLRALGLTRVYGNDGTTGWCTVTHASRYFSHRRDRTSGRFAASVWLA